MSEYKIFHRSVIPKEGCSFPDMFNCYAESDKEAIEQLNQKVGDSVIVLAIYSEGILRVSDIDMANTHFYQKTLALV